MLIPFSVDISKGLQVRPAFQNLSLLSQDQPDQLGIVMGEDRAGGQEYTFQLCFVLVY